ncbi:hypothetical protein SAMN05216390_11056 [Lachnospiraceae bacterium KH1T2]|nr:hypothetical protein SAMN05216390_11056 [Lachnospiraceae bacterium KH1T2]
MDNHEVQLTKIVNTEDKDKLISMLVKARVSYLEKWERVPFFKRREFNGKKEVCVIYVNENQKEQADEIYNSFMGMSKNSAKEG